MSIRASAILIGSICVIHPRDQAFQKWRKPPRWMQLILYLPGVKSGFINSNGEFVKASNARLSAFCSGQLEDGTSSNGILKWDMLKW
jgi:hypothetical protein